MNNENFNIAPNDENEEFTVEFGEVINDGGTHDYNELDNQPQINGHTLEGNKTNEQLGIPVYSAGENIKISDDYVISATGGGGGTSDYEDLSNLPKLNNVTLKGNKSLSDLGIQPAGNYALESEIPTKTSDLTNDSGFITGYTETDPTVPSHVKNITQANITNWNNKLDSEDLTDYVKNSNYADNSNFGVVKTNYNYGIQTENGVLYINRASAAQIISRHQWAPITPKNFDLALKLGMCDGVGEAWTEDEKLKAQERIGVSKIPSGMTLTADVVLEESVKRVDFNEIIVKNYEKLIIYVFRPATIFSSGYGSISFASNVGGQLGGTEYNAFSTNQKISVRHTMVKTDGTKFEATTEWVNAGNNINDTAFIKSTYKPDANSYSGYLVINTSQTFPIGTHILIYTK